MSKLTAFTLVVFNYFSSRSFLFAFFPYNQIYILIWAQLVALSRAWAGGEINRNNL